jgi:hypothetical protein
MAQTGDPPSKVIKQPKQAAEQALAVDSVRHAHERPVVLLRRDRPPAFRRRGLVPPHRERVLREERHATDLPPHGPIQDAVEELDIGPDRPFAHDGGPSLLTDPGRRRRSEVQTFDRPIGTRHLNLKVAVAAAYDELRDMRVIQVGDEDHALGREEMPPDCGAPAVLGRPPAVAYLACLVLSEQIVDP